MNISLLLNLNTDGKLIHRLYGECIGHITLDLGIDLELDNYYTSLLPQIENFVHPQIKKVIQEKINEVKKQHPESEINYYAQKAMKAFFNILDKK